ncbi:MAG TPA: archaetidylserine decarboxylase [Kofleriaceae bacterium]|nr:archaetidylserine decarboxylase [Kofleriaceae bacterium]
MAGPVYSALVGKAARRRVPVPLRSAAYRAFARAVGADLTEAELDLRAYASLGDLFARRLRPGMRPIDAELGSIVAPCDGVLAARGTAVDGALIQAKGKTYQLDELLGLEGRSESGPLHDRDRELAARLTGGEYATIYLSPRDYHRVHTPVDGRLVRYDYIPGALWPVNPVVAARRDRLLVRNERVVITIDAGRLGRVAIVMVGAAGVGNIALEYAPESVTWRAQGERRRIELDHELARGDELGAFRLGSTVVMVFEPKAVTLSGEVGQMMRFGERMGAFSYGGRA